MSEDPRDLTDKTAPSPDNGAPESSGPGGRPPSVGAQAPLAKIPPEQAFPDQNPPDSSAPIPSSKDPSPSAPRSLPGSPSPKFPSSRLASPGNIILLFLFAAGLAFAVWGHVALSQGDFHPASLPQDPQRVITLAPSVTEIAFAVGLGPKVVGVTKFCRYPPEVEKLPRVAGFSDMNIEAIVRLRPDLVILPADKAENRRELTRLGLSVLSVDTRTLEGLIKALEDLGKATGRESEAQKVVDAINEAVSEAGRRAEGKPKPKVMFSVMHSYAGLGYISELTIAGRDGFFDHLIEICGGENAYPGKLPFPSVSREAVFRMNPDVIIDLMRSYSEAEDSMESWNTMTSVSAVQKGRVYMFTEESDTVPGPRAWKTIKKVSMVLHPDPENPPPQILGDVP